MPPQGESVLSRVSICARNRRFRLRACARARLLAASGFGSVSSEGKRSLNRSHLSVPKHVLLFSLIHEKKAQIDIIIEQEVACFPPVCRRRLRLEQPHRQTQQLDCRLSCTICSPSTATLTDSATLPTLKAVEQKRSRLTPLCFDDFLRPAVGGGATSKGVGLKKIRHN